MHNSFFVPPRRQFQTSFRGHYRCQIRGTGTTVGAVSGPDVTPWWNEPDYVVPGLLSVIAATLGGDLVLWIRVDAVNGQATILDIVEPNPAAQGIAERLRASNSPPPEWLGTSVARSGQPLLVPQLDLTASAVNAFPQPWSEYLANHPVVGVIAVPVTLHDGATGVLITARRTTTSPYTPDDLRYVESGVRRLAGTQVKPPSADESDIPAWSPKRLLASQRRWFHLRELVVGAGPPTLIMVVLGSMADSAKFHPGALLLLGCVFAAVFSGVRAAILSAVASTVTVWWAFTPSERSWRFATRSDAIGVALFLAALIGVILLVFRLDEARNKERLERQFSDSLLEHSPVAMAVLDRDLRFRRVNQPMAEMNGRAPADHVGLRPGDLNPLAGQMYEHLLVRVRDSGQPITNHELTISMPKVGFERDWKLSLRPLHNQESEVVGIGVTIMDVTQEIVTRRLAEQLFHLAESLSTSVDERQIAGSICSFLADTFQGRSAVAYRHDEALVITAVSGFAEAEVSRWRGATIGLHENNPLSEAVLINQPIILSDIAEFDERYPHLAVRRAADWDRASVSMPLRSEDAGLALGAMYVGWSTPRSITEEMTIVLGTVSSLATLALARIAATNLAHRDEFRHSLEAMLDDVAIGRAVRSDGGEIIDFRIEFANSSGIDGIRRNAELIIGRLVCDVYPNWRDSGMFDRLCDVVETGTPYQVDRMPFSNILGVGDAPERYMSLQVAKLGDGYIAASRDVSNLVAADMAALALTLQVETERTAIQLLQSAALPNSLPESPGVRIAAVYEPSDPHQPVGGDWYDAFTLDEDRVALVIADVAGHGRHAAIFMVQVRNVFRALAVEHPEPGEVMIRANNVTSKLNEPDGPFVTCCYAVLDVRARTLQWAQAGHFSPLIVHADGTSTYLTERSGPPLALSGARHYESSSTKLHLGDRVMMFTDGLVERRREHLDVGLARLARIAKDCSALQPQEFVEALAASVTDRFDDLALLCVELATGD